MFLVVTVVGLTVALFTSNDDDGKIGINVTSGECKIDIVDLGGKTLVGDVLNFVTPDNREKIYFEPGSTYYTEGFKISNIGKIPVNFRVYVSEDAQANRYSIEEAFEDAKYAYSDYMYQKNLKAYDAEFENYQKEFESGNIDKAEFDYLVMSLSEKYNV
jgi:hypothetical protein